MLHKELLRLGKKMAKYHANWYTLTDKQKRDLAEIEAQFTRVEAVL
jgi:hypothetical protein